MTANLKTESDMHYCLHIIKSPDTYSFCCVSNHYMYYYYYYYFILPWNCPSLISKLIIIIILFSHGIVRHLSQSSLLSLFYSPMELSVTYLKAQTLWSFTWMLSTMFRCTVMYQICKIAMAMNQIQKHKNDPSMVTAEHNSRKLHRNIL